MEELVTQIKTKLSELDTEIAERNAYIEKRDQYVYGDFLEKNLDLPVGHDRTPINWMRRTVEIHRDTFMGRGFIPASTFDTQDPDVTDPKEKERVTIENKARKSRADARVSLIAANMMDNGGMSLFKELAENASAVGFSVLKAYWDEDAEFVRWVPVESVENFRAYWNSDNFRDTDLYAFVYQVSEQFARETYGLKDEEVETSPLGKPLEVATQTSYNQNSTQKMVTVLEVTGKIAGWGSKKGKLKQVPKGKENNVNLLIVGNKIKKVIDDKKKIPRYYIFPNKKQRRRPWGVSDISDAAIETNLTYIETFSDWRTIANKVNFPKYRFFNFGPDAQLPKFESRKIQGIPLSADQDIQILNQGDPNSIDWNRQLEEEKEQYLREVAISRILFDDPSVDYNSNQALMTGMKVTTDVAETKKSLWEPVIIQLFNDTLQIAADNRPEIKELLDEDMAWTFKVRWPSTLQKEDPVYQQMLVNRLTTNSISLRTFLEEQGETGEELERIRDELNDPLTAAIHARSLGMLVAQMFAPENPGPDVKVSLRGDLTPYQEANLAHQQGFNDGPFPPTAGPQGSQGNIAQENQDNQGFLNGNPFTGGTPIQQGPDGQPVAPINTQANNAEGTGAVSLPGSGQAPAVTPQGSINQQNQNLGG
jgi:hypothetical protein